MRQGKIKMEEEKTVYTDMPQTKILCAVYDKKAHIYDGYMIFENQVQAVRAFAKTCEDNEVFKKWPEDFDFYRMAFIFKDTGEVDNKLEKLASALNFVEKPKKK